MPASEWNPDAAPKHADDIDRTLHESPEDWWDRFGNSKAFLADIVCRFIHRDHVVYQSAEF